MARATQPMNPGRMLMASVALALASSAVSAQTFIIASPVGLRLSSTPIAPGDRFDNDEPADVDRIHAATRTGPALANAAPARPGSDRLHSAGASMPESITANGTLPRANSLNLSLDVARFTPGSTPLATVPDGEPGADGAPALPSFAAVTQARASNAALAAPHRTLVAHDDASDVALSFNVRGFSLLQMNNDADTDLSFSAVPDDTWRLPILSLTLQKKF